MSQFFQSQIAKFPPYWKLASIRCSIYAIIVGVNAFFACVEGYSSFSDMSWLQIIKMCLNILIAILGVWVAFLDQTLARLRPGAPHTNP
jgi:uncharacterized membrane protein